MKLAQDGSLDQWLAGITGAAGQLDWDAGFLAGRIVDPPHDEPRWLLLGETIAGRRLTLIFTRRRDQLRPISCRPMRATKGRSMKKRSSKAVQRKASKRDLQVEEFDKRDLGQDIRAARRLRPIRKNLPTSIVLEPDLIDKLRKKAAKRGLGYQTMLKVIVREHVDEY